MWILYASKCHLTLLNTIGGWYCQLFFLVCSEMIPAVAARGLATFCDVFCENGYFDATFTEQV